MHHAQTCIDAIFRSSTQPSPPLNAAQATALRLALNNDAANYLYSGAVSIGDAIQAMERSLFTWATVKLYYSTFYLIRSILASTGHAIFYRGTKPFGLACSAGETASRRAGTTHKVVLNYFSAAFSNSRLLSQDIAACKPLEWLMQLREQANYLDGRFVEPNPPKHFQVIAREGLRRSIAAYVKDETFLYAFDPDHAMLAYPLQALKEALAQSLGAGHATFPDGEARRFAQGLFADKAGPIAEVVQLLRG